MVALCFHDPGKSMGQTVCCFPSFLSDLYYQLRAYVWKDVHASCANWEWWINLAVQHSNLRLILFYMSYA